MNRPKASLAYAAFTAYRFKPGTVFSPQGPIRITRIFQKYRLPFMQNKSPRRKAQAEKNIKIYGKLLDKYTSV